jgi:hypothetical protein
MSSHHDHDNHSTESKPVSFRTPLIMGLVTVFLILVGVSTCDGGKHKCKDDCSKECMKKCEAGDHARSGHEAAKHETHEEETHEANTEEHTSIADTLVKADTTSVKEVKAEAHAPAHH